MIRSLARPVVRPLVRAINEILSGFSPQSLFASGAQGFWYDPADFSTLFQDSAGTTPVTAVGQSVGRILDKSGRGNHLIQATAASRGILRQDSNGKYYIEFDGTDDGYASAATVNFSATDEITVFAGVRKSSDAARGCLVELGNASTNAFKIFAPDAAASATYTLYNGGSATAQAVTPTSYAAPITNVLTGIGDISADSCILRVNGTQAASSSTDQGTGNYGNLTLYVGRRGGTTLPFNGRLYQLIGVGKTCTALEINQTERFTAGRTGVSW